MRKNSMMSFMALAALTVSTPALATACAGNPAALGTSRIIALDTNKGMALGQQYGHDLPLADKEVVLTFDDGPLPIFSEKVRTILEEQCVRATFFLVGRNASAYPDFVRKLASDGHTIASHTMTHNMNLDEKALEPEGEIGKGIAAIDRALKTSTAQNRTAPFFRFPGLTDKSALREKMEQNGIAVLSIDIEGGDWIKEKTSKDVLARVMKQLHEKRKGIILLHDIQPRTVKMLPEFLAKLKSEGYKIVHLMPSSQPTPLNMTVANVSSNMLIKSGSTQKMDDKNKLAMETVKTANVTVPVVINEPKQTSFAAMSPVASDQKLLAVPVVVKTETHKPDEIDALLQATKITDAEPKKPQSNFEQKLASLAPQAQTTEHVKSSRAQRPYVEDAMPRPRKASASASSAHKSRKNIRQAAERTNRKNGDAQLAVASPDYIQHRKPAASEYLLNSIFNSMKVN